MSDHGAEPDPMDKAYVQAEAVLDDAAERAARRARVLAAAASEPVTPAASSPLWRQGRWLAAAGVAGLAVLTATQIYQPAWRQQPIASTTPAAPTPAAQTPGVLAAKALPGPPAPAVSAAPAPQAVAAAGRAAPPASPPELAPSAPPPPAIATSAPEAFPKAAPPPPPPPPPEVAVAAERRESDQALAAQSAVRGAAQKAPVAITAFTGPSASVDQAQSLAGLPPDQAARLRAAAAAGRTAEVDALLGQGVAVDAPDARGDTALMKSIEAEQPAAAALLRRHGASLDRKNKAGESARDMVRAKGDPALNQAVGLGP